MFTGNKNGWWRASIKDKRTLVKDFISIETPERIKIRYKIASPLSRVLAYILDRFIMGLALVLIISFILYLQNFTFDEAINRQRGISFFFIFLILFFLEWGYFIFFELLLNGQTPGKKLLHLRVIQYHGTYLDLSSIVLRNLLRFVDMEPTFYLGAIFSTLLNRDHRRIGDLVGGTVVIRQEKYNKNLPDFKIKQAYKINNEALNVFKKLSEKDLYILRRFLNSLDKFSPEKKEELAEKMARTLQKKIKDQIDFSDPVEYLQKLYIRHQNE